MGKGKKEKQQVKTKPDKGKTQKKWGQTTKEREIIKRDVFIQDEIKKQMDEEVPKMKEITVSKVSMKYNIVQSVAKQYLDELYKQKKIQRISKNARISIYTSLEIGKRLAAKKAEKVKKEVKEQPTPAEVIEEEKSER